MLSLVGDMEWMKRRDCVMKWRIVLQLLISLAQSAISQPTYPYITFGGRQQLPNHSFVNMSQLQEDSSTAASLVCHTDLVTCCSSSEGPVHRGYWAYPNGSLVPSLESNGLVVSRGNRMIELRSTRGGSGPSGIYHCMIPTNAHHVDNSASYGEILYVGIYSIGGDIQLLGDIIMAVISDLNGPSPQFTLTCISIGGPATTVTWTRDSTPVAEGTETEIRRLGSAIYSHTLTGSTNGQYTFTVANSKPSSASASTTIPGPSAPTNVTLVQEGPTAINVSWTPSGDAQYHRIEWQCTASESGSQGSIRTQSYRLTDFQNGEICNISVSATLERHFPSASVRLTVQLVPDAPDLGTGSFNTTVISLLWRAPTDSVVTGYEVEWEGNRPRDCRHDGDKGNIGITDPSITNYDIVGLAEGTTYTVTVKAFNQAGSSVGATINATTTEEVPSAPPLFVRISGTTVSTITVQWGAVECDHHNGEITGYSVRYREVGGGSEMSVERVGPDQREFTLSGLSYATFTIQVAAVNNAGTGVYSTSLTAKTHALDIVVESSSTTHLVISWIRAEGIHATSYNISYYNTHCLTTDYIDDITTSQDVYNLTELQEGTEYSITVRFGRNKTGERSITASTMPTAPSAAPTYVRVSQVTFSDVTLVWEAIPCLKQNGDITGYSVRYAKDKSNEYNMNVFGGNVTQATISGLDPSTNHSIQVAGVNAAGTGEYSDPLSLTTRESVYLSLRGDYVPNRGYVSVGDIGSSDSTALLCHTNRPNSNAPSHPHSGGDWFAPNRNRVNRDNTPGFRRNRGLHVVRLTRHAADTQPPNEGIYCCYAEDRDSVAKVVCVGIYSNSGAVSIAGNIIMAVISDLNGPSPQFILTCISTGGPATTVTWTGDSTPVAEGTETVLDDPVTAQYTHTLTVSGRPEGLYICTVSNNKPSQDSAQLNVQDLVSNPFEEFSLLNFSSTSLTFSWTLTPVASLLISGYNITCTPLVEGIPLPEPLVVREPNAVTASVTELYPGVSYTCAIITFNSWQTSLPRNITYSIPEIAPSGSPEKFEAVAGQRQVVFTWSPPPVTQRNGVITNYTLSCSPSPSSLPQSPSSQSVSLTVTGFSPNTLYSCSLVATNSQGSGPPSNISFTTLEDYSYFQLRLHGVASCPEYTLTLTNEKLSDITDTLVDELTTSCADCAITIDEEYFVCDPESPGYVTYRARLEGTSETDSGSLVSLIETWISSQPSIIVARVEINIDVKCPLAILSYNNTEGSCKPPTITETASQSVLDDSGAVIGGAVAVILIIALTVITVTVVKLRIALHTHREPANTVWGAEQVMMTDLPGVKDISTYSNVAYDEIKLQAMTGGREEGGEGSSGSSGDDSHYATICCDNPPNPNLPTPREYENPVAISEATENPRDDTASNPTAPAYVNVGEGATAGAGAEEVVYDLASK